MSVISDENKISRNNKYEIKNHSINLESSCRIQIDDSRIEPDYNIELTQQFYNVNSDNVAKNYLDTKISYNKSSKLMRDSNFSNIIEPEKNSCIFSVKEVDPDLLLEELIKFEEIKDSFKNKSTKSSLKSKKDKSIKSLKDTTSINKKISQIQETEME